MVSVTQRISQIKQPRGGYLPLSKFECIQLNDGVDLYPSENVEGYLVGTVVDYLSRWKQFNDKEDAFHISMLGGIRSGRENETHILLDNIIDLSDDSLINACRLVYFDAYTRGTFPSSDSYDGICPDHETCENIRIMVDRVIDFFQDYGPVTEDGFHLYGGYSDIVDRGDGDFLTEDTVWDIKVLRKDPQSNKTLQLLMYYLMGKRSIDPNFSSVCYIGIYNPRLNRIHRLEVDKLDKGLIYTVETEVIGYSPKNVKTLDDF